MKPTNIRCCHQIELFLQFYLGNFTYLLYLFIHQRNLFLKIWLKFVYFTIWGTRIPNYRWSLTKNRAQELQAIKKSLLTSSDLSGSVRFIMKRMQKKNGWKGLVEIKKILRSRWTEVPSVLERTMSYLFRNANVKMQLASCTTFTRNATYNEFMYLEVYAKKCCFIFARIYMYGYYWYTCEVFHRLLLYIILSFVK